MSVTSISLEPAEQATPTSSARLEEWKDKLLELLRLMPPDTALRLFDRGVLRVLLTELAKDDPLLALCIKMHETQR